MESSVIRPVALATLDLRRREEAMLSDTGAPHGDQTVEVRSKSASTS
jgi:hypothetical protein